MKKRTMRQWTTALTAGCMALGMGMTAQAAEYPDVNPGDWYYGSVQYASDKGLMTGYDNGTFGPGDNLTRGQFATILYRMSGSPEVEYTAQYPDVSDGWFYSDAVTWAKGTGVITGYDNGNFGPNDNITREQMATILYRNDGSPAVGGNGLGEFPDGGQVSEFAKNGVLWAVQNQIITGDKGNIVPQGNAVRAHCATILQRYLEGAVPEQPSNPQQPHQPSEPQKPDTDKPVLKNPDDVAKINAEKGRWLAKWGEKNGWDVIEDDYGNIYCCHTENNISYVATPGNMDAIGHETPPHIATERISKASGKVEIASNFDGIEVTIIGDFAPYGNESITEIVIPASVKTMAGVGDVFPFANYKNLKVLRFCGDMPECADELFNLPPCKVYYPKNASGWNMYVGDESWMRLLEAHNVQLIPY